MTKAATSSIPGRIAERKPTRKSTETKSLSSLESALRPYGAFVLTRGRTRPLTLKGSNKRSNIFEEFFFGKIFRPTLTVF